MAPQKVLKYSHYMFTWYTSRVAQHVAIPRAVILRIAIPLVSQVIIPHKLLYP